MMKGKLPQPYVGPRTFEERHRDLFFGRDKEARQLLSLVVAERLVLFYAQSGAGKSSLINARLRPNLVAEDFVVLPTARVGGALPDEINQVDNIFVFNLISSMESGPGNAADFVKTNLTTYLRTMYQKNKAFDEFGEEKAQVLIIDQFEEIVTTHLRRWGDRRDFFVQLAAAMEKIPLLWVVLSLREDHVAAIEPYARFMPGGMRKRYYMQRMKEGAALRAIEGPAAKEGRPFTAKASRQLVDDLRQLRAAGQAGTDEPQPRGASDETETEGEEALGEFIEPVQLQVVCYQLWENLNALDDPPDGIDITHLQEFGDVDEALAQFYETAIEDVIEQTGESELFLRTWFERSLITKDKTRGTVFQGQEETAGLANETVQLLDDKFLLHAEERHGGLWYELVHDRFVEPILRANQTWRDEQDSLFHAALDWDEADRPESKLQTGALLQRTKEDIGERNLEGFVADFLAASEEADKELQQREAHRQREFELERDRANEQARRVRVTIVALAVSLVFLLLAVGFFFQAQSSAEEAIESRDLAATRQAEAEVSEDKAIAAASQAEDERAKAEIAEGIAEFARSDAQRALEQAQAAERQARALLYETRGVDAYEEQPLLGMRLLIESVAIEEDRQRKAERLTGARDLILQGRVANLGADIETLTPHPDNPALFVLKPEEGLSQVWHPNRLEPVRLQVLPPKAVRFSPGGDLLVIDYDDAPGELVRAEDGVVLATFNDAIGNSEANSEDDFVFFSPNPEVSAFVVNYEDWPAELWTWDAEEGARAEVLKGEVGQVYFNPEATLFVVDYFDDDVPDEMWRLRDREVLATYEDDVLAALPRLNDAAMLLSFSLSKELELISADGQSLASGISAVTFSSDGTRFAVDYFSPDIPDGLLDADGDTILEFEGEVSDETKIEFFSDAPLFLVKYEDEAQPDELRRSENGEVLATDFEDVSFSPDGTRFIVDYGPDSPSALGKVDGGDLETGISQVLFSPDQSRYIVAFADPALPNELRSLDDDQVLARFERNLSVVTFSSDLDATLFAINYNDAPAEVRRSDDGRLLAVLASDEFEVVDHIVSLDLEAGGTRFVVTYSTESGFRTVVHRSSDGAALVTFTEQDDIRDLIFSPDAAASVFVVRYGEAPPELRRLADGQVQPLTDEALAITPYRDAGVFVVDYVDTNISSELRSLVDGEPMAEGISEVIVNEDSSRFVVDYKKADVADELWDAADGPIERFEAEISSAFFVPDASFLALNYEDPERPAELRDAETGKVVIELSEGAVSWVDMSPDEAVLVVYSVDGSAKVYHTSEEDQWEVLGSFSQFVRSVHFDREVSGKPLTTDHLTDVATDLEGDRWTFSGSEGDIVTIDLRSDEFDTFLELEEADGDYLLNNDDGGPGTNSLISGYRLPDTGIYTIVARGLGDGIGRYSLSVKGITTAGAESETEQPAVTAFLVEYGGESEGITELWSVDEGRRLSSFFDVWNAFFSRDPDRSLLIVQHGPSGRYDVRRSADGGNVAALGADISRLVFSYDNESTYFLLYYDDGEVELRRTADGVLIARITRELTDRNPVLLSPGGNAPIFGLWYPGPESRTELYRSGGGGLFAITAADAYELLCAPEEQATVCIVAYTAEPGEVRDAVSGLLLEPLPDTIERLTPVPNTNPELIIVDYANEASELRGASDGGRLDTLPGKGGAIISLPGSNDEFFIINFADAPSQVRRASDGLVETQLSGHEATVNAGYSEQVFIVDYANDDEPSQMVSMADGRLLQTLSGNANWVRFSPDEDARFFVINYDDGSAEVRGGGNGALWQTLNGEVRDVNFSTDPEAKRFVVRYFDGTAEIRRSDGGGLLTTLEGGEVEQMIFSTDPDATLIGVNYTNNVAEVRRTADGSVLTELTSDEYEAVFDFFSLRTGAEASLFVVGSYTNVDETIEVRRMDDGSAVATFTWQDDVRNVYFSSTAETSVFVVQYQNGRWDLRSIDDGDVVQFADEETGEMVGEVEYIRIFEEANVFIAYYFDAPGELRSLVDGALLAKGVSTVSLSPDSRRFVVEFADSERAKELWSTEGDQVESAVSNVYFSPEGAHFVVDHFYEDEPDELRSAAGGPLDRFNAEILDAIFMPESTLFVVNYEQDGIPSELRRADSGEIVATLSDDEISRIDFSSDGMLIVAYNGDGSAAVYRQAEEREWELLQEFPSTVSYILFDNEPFGLETTLFADRIDDRVTDAEGDRWTFTGRAGDAVTIDMQSPDMDTYLDLLDAEGNRLISNDDSRDSLNSLISGYELPYSGSYTIVARGFSGSTGSYTLAVEGINPTSADEAADRDTLPARALVVEYDNGLMLQWSITGMQEIERFSRVERVNFSPDPDRSLLIVEHSSGRREIHLARKDEDVAEDISDLVFSPDPDKTYFVATYADGGGGVFLTATGAELAPLTGEVVDVAFSNDEQGSLFPYFYVRYEDGQRQVWILAGESARSLADLGDGVEDTFWDLPNRQLIVHYADGHVYRVDLGLLETLWNTSSDDQLLNATCDYLYSPGVFSNAAMADYLDEGVVLEGCR